MLLGLVIMTLGMLWTLDNLRLIDSGAILRWWPLVLVAIGVGKLLGVWTSRHTIAGAVFVAVGAWFLADTFDLVDVGFGELWPLFLVLLGAQLLTRSLSRQRQGDTLDQGSKQLGSFAFLSGVERKVVSDEFRGGELTAVAGGCNIDLRGAKPVPGGAVLDVFVWWGGIDLIVPDHWRVVNEVTAVLGGIEDKTKTAPADGRDTLLVRGLVVMGGIEIKN